MSTPLPNYDLAAVRRDFPISERLIYVNHASVSPLPLPTKNVMQSVIEQVAQDPMSFFTTPPPENVFVRFSTEIASFINAAAAHEVVGVTSTSTALNLIAQAIDWQPGDNIVFAEVEFPSNAYPWMVLERRGVECRLAPADQGGASLDAFAPLVDGRTRLIAASAIQFLSGHRTDLAEIGAFCRERGILFAVDAIQAAGHIPIDVQAMNIDVLASGGQKSLMGPSGQGFLYVRDEVCSRMAPGLIGPNAVEGWEHWLAYDLTPRQGASRFMMGTPNVDGMFGLLESIRYLDALGRAHIDAWTRHLSRLAIDGLADLGYTVITPQDARHYGPIVTFRVGDPADIPAASQEATALNQHLMQHYIRVTRHLDACGVPHLRVSTHCYNTEDEIRQIIDVVKEYRP